MNMNDKILITGGTGMVGKHLQKILPEAVYVGSNIDLRDWISVDALFNRLKPTRVIHLAAKVGGIQANISSPADFYEDNNLQDLVNGGIDRDLELAMQIEAQDAYEY